MPVLLSYNKAVAGRILAGGMVSDSSAAAQVALQCGAQRVDVQVRLAWVHRVSVRICRLLQVGDIRVVDLIGSVSERDCGSCNHLPESGFLQVVHGKPGRLARVGSGGRPCDALVDNTLLASGWLVQWAGPVARLVKSSSGMMAMHGLPPHSQGWVAAGNLVGDSW